MSYDVAISVENVTKIYPIYKKPIDRLKEFFLFNKVKYHNEFYALNNISFQVPKGKTMGIIGKNGSGKSTLLQIIAGTLAATSGTVKLQGKVAAILELGAGFNPDFTGRENVYLNGAILGLSKKEIDEKYQDIIAFADIGDFIDRPVKTYSSGMFVRLAFSIAVNVDPDILIVDEALAVGDIFFTHKCKNKIKEIVNSGKTVLFVSHDIATIKSFCDIAILIEKGSIIMQGSGEEVADVYQKSMHEENYQRKSISTKAVSTTDRPQLQDADDWFESEHLLNARGNARFGDGAARFRGIKICAANGKEESLFHHDQDIIVETCVEVIKDIETKIEFGILIRDINGIDICGFNSHVLGESLAPQKSGTKVKLSFAFKASFAPGSYSLVLGLKEDYPSTHYFDKVFTAGIFEIAPTRPGYWIPGIVKIPGNIKCKVVTKENEREILSTSL